MVTEENNVEKSIFKGLPGPSCSTVKLDVLERKFPICDVAGGQFGNP